MVSVTQGLKNSPSLFKMRTWPDGSFTIGADSPPQKDTRQDGATRIDSDTWWNGYKDVTALRAETDQAAIARCVEAKHPGPLSDEQRAALFDAYEESGQYEKAIALVDSAAVVGASPMGLSVASNYHKSPSKNKRGHGGITSYGKRMTRSCGAILEQAAYRRCLSLVTCTLPPMSPEENFKVCKDWAQIVRKFFQELRRLLVRKGLSPNYIYVSEVQEGRFERFNQVWLHLHLIFMGRKNAYSQWAVSKDEIREIWERVLSNCLERPVDGSVATRIEQPRKSLRAELGKYLSKGSKIIRRITDAGMDHLLPASWWGASSELKKQVKAQIQVYKGEVVNRILKNVKRFALEKKLTYREKYIEFVDWQTGIRREIRVGIAGFFRYDNALQEILSELNEDLILDKVA